MRVGVVHHVIENHPIEPRAIELTTDTERLNSRVLFPTVTAPNVDSALGPALTLKSTLRRKRLLQLRVTRIRQTVLDSAEELVGEIARLRDNRATSIRVLDDLPRRVIDTECR